MHLRLLLLLCLKMVIDSKVKWTDKALFVHKTVFWLWPFLPSDYLSDLCLSIELFPLGFLKDINPGYSLEGLMLKLQYFGHLMQRDDSLKKTLMLGKIEGRKRSRWQRMRRLNGITDSMDKFEQTPRDTEGQGSLVCCSLSSCCFHSYCGHFSVLN